MSEMSDSLISNVDNSCTAEDSNLTLKYSRQNIQLRRAEVLRLQAMGESESSIARSLGCSQALISLDVAFLKEMAKNKIAEHLGNLAYELDKVLTGLDILIKTTYSWLNAPQFTTTTTTTVKDKAMLLTLISNLYNMKWELLTDKDPNTIHHAAQYVTRAKEELEKQIEYAQMRWDLTDEEEEEEEEGLEEEEEENNNV
jgi:hypothetical protein